MQGAAKCYVSFLIIRIYLECPGRYQEVLNKRHQPVSSRSTDQAPSRIYPYALPSADSRRWPSPLIGDGHEHDVGNDPPGLLHHGDYSGASNGARPLMS